MGLDRDPQAMEIARERLSGIRGQGDSGARGIFADRRSCGEAKSASADGVLADLGISSCSWISPERGFSFRSRGAARHAHGPRLAETAADIVNHGRRKNSPTCSTSWGGAGFTQNRQGDRSRASHPGHRTPGNGCGRGPKSKGKAETASRDKNVSGAADCGESRDGGTRAVSF